MRFPLKCMTAANYYIVEENGIISRGLGSSTTPGGDLACCAVWQGTSSKQSPFPELSSLCTSVSCSFIYLFIFSTFIYFWDRERQSMSGGGAEREGDTESETGSRL